MGTVLPPEGRKPPAWGFDGTIRWSEGIREVGLELQIWRGGGVTLPRLWSLEITIPFRLEDGGSMTGVFMVFAEAIAYSFGSIFLNFIPLTTIRLSLATSYVQS